MPLTATRPRTRFLSVAALAALTLPLGALTAQAAPADGELSNEWAWNAEAYEHLVDAGYAIVDADETVFAIDGPAVAELASGLAVTDASRVGYDRDLFPHWSDLDGNGRDTRNDILVRDLTDVTFTDASEQLVATGTLADPYTGEAIDFQRGQGTSNAVQIDHLIPLAAAWTGGADDWTTDEREQFANDPINLLAVDGPANSSKSDKLPSEWMPANDAYHCTYAAQITVVADTYDLAVTEADRSELVATADACALPEWAQDEEDDAAGEAEEPGDDTQADVDTDSDAEGSGEPDSTDEAEAGAEGDNSDADGTEQPGTDDADATSDENSGADVAGDPEPGAEDSDADASADSDAGVADADAGGTAGTATDGTEDEATGTANAGLAPGVEAPSVEAPAVEQPAAENAPESETELAQTGGDALLPVLLIAGGLVLVGAAALLITYRRDRAQQPTLDE
ncbi:MAG: GmrSD restriction endonuclease domain-containing protein [Microbacteriaceae bacterium]